MDRGGWWATVHGVTEKSDMTKRPTLSLSQGIRRTGIMVRTDPSSTPEHMSALGCHHHPHQMRRKGEQKGYTEARGRGRASGAGAPAGRRLPRCPVDNTPRDSTHRSRTRGGLHSRGDNGNDTQGFRRERGIINLEEQYSMLAHLPGPRPACEPLNQGASGLKTPRSPWRSRPPMANCPQPPAPHEATLSLQRAVSRRRPRQPAGTLEPCWLLAS